MNQGWIKLYRKFLESPIWVYSVSAHMPHLISLWTFILISANWEEKKWYDGKSEIVIPTGSLITSISHLGINTNTTPQQVRTALDHYEKMNMITRKTTSLWTQIWIVNWDKYQMKDNSNNKPITNEQQTNNKPITTTKEVKNKEVKNIRVENTPTYLINIPEQDLIAFSGKYSASRSDVIKLGDKLKLWCEANNKTKKNYRSFLQDRLLEQFGYRATSQVVNGADYVAIKEAELEAEGNLSFTPDYTKFRKVFN